MRKFKNRLAAILDPQPAAQPKKYRILTPYRAPSTGAPGDHLYSSAPPTVAAAYPATAITQGIIGWFAGLQQGSHSAHEWHCR